ncbi:unnamed protein product [Hymenolepis diminuta]|uniref:Uncharacterized protein n=1 Tax=Hymenolepis diminuta TaxID=6216 RepID=A0A564Z1M8_HYMDI|nr:unnamed protein product [Hymenolepis diminuta]VUZ53320.1 unnamed protein product [Hymenolepis diminuta]
MRYEATFLEKTIFKKCYVTNRSIKLTVSRRKRNRLDTYSRTYECGECRESMRPVSTCCQNPSSFYSYSTTETRFSQDSGLTYHSGHTKGVTCTTVINSHSKVSDVILL